MTEVLDDCPLLSEFIAEDRRALTELLSPRELDAGAALFRVSDEAEELFFVESGSLSIRTDGQPIADLGAGEVLGGLSLVTVGRRECDAVAVEPTRLLALSREAYLRLRTDRPALALQLQEAVLRSFAALVRSSLADSRPAAA